jgi:hypothetical protein
LRVDKPNKHVHVDEIKTQFRSQVAELCHVHDKPTICEASLLYWQHDQKTMADSCTSGDSFQFSFFISLCDPVGVELWSNSARVVAFIHMSYSLEKYD